MLIIFKFSAFQQDNAKRRTDEFARQGDTRRPGANDANIGLDDAVGRHRCRIDQHVQSLRSS
jgi:hypothetical protein